VVRQAHHQKRKSSDIREYRTQDTEYKRQRTEDRTADKLRHEEILDRITG